MAIASHGPSVGALAFSVSPQVTDSISGTDLPVELFFEVVERHSAQFLGQVEQLGRTQNPSFRRRVHYRPGLCRNQRLLLHYITLH